MSERTITLKIKKIKAGQPRAYADSEYEFEIEAEGMTGYEVKEYCTHVLEPCGQPREKWDTTNEDSYFAGYYTFEKTDTNRYRYYVRRPYCD